MTEEKLLKSSLDKYHNQAGANMGSEAGWSMPMSFAGVIDEYNAVTTHAGVFDVSNIGRVRVRGDGALDLLERVCTADVARQEDNTAQKTLLCNEAGGILDLCVLTRLESMWVLTTSPMNRFKILEHLKAQEIPGAKVDDQTQKVGQLYATGPAAEEILNAVLPVKVSGMNAGDAKMGSMLIASYIATRTGYSPMWGLEVMLPGMLIGKAWEFITKKAGDRAMKPCGIACREILRIEAGYCRYGHEISEAIDPVTAGLMDLVKLDHDFIGADAIAKLAEKSPARRRVMLKFDEISENATIPRLGDPIFDDDGVEIGTVTSGTLSPAENTVIALGYVTTATAIAGQPVVLPKDSSTLSGMVSRVLG